MLTQVPPGDWTWVPHDGKQTGGPLDQWNCVYECSEIAGYPQSKYSKGSISLAWTVCTYCFRRMRNTFMAIYFWTKGLKLACGSHQQIFELTYFGGNMYITIVRACRFKVSSLKKLNWLYFSYPPVGGFSATYHTGGLISLSVCSTCGPRTATTSELHQLMLLKIKYLFDKTFIYWLNTVSFCV